MLNHEKSYFEVIEASTGLKAKIKAVTRIESNSCIDNILTKMKGRNTVSSIAIADHQALTSAISTVVPRIHKRNIYKYREMNERNWDIFSQEIGKILITGDNINEKWSNLCESAKKAVEKAFPEKLSKREYSFTMSQGLLKSKQKKNKLLKKYKKGLIPKETYIAYNKIYRKLVAKEREDTFRKKILESGIDSKKKWRVLKTELKLTSKKETIDEIRIGESTVTEKIEIARGFKTHFETCAAKLARDVPDSGNNEILIEQQENWNFEPISEADLLKIIDSLLPKSSCGFDLLSNRMIKKEKFKFSKLLLGLINETLQSNTFPNALKLARVIPIFKKGDKTNMNNYRPIALLPALSKVLEKVINKQINKKLDDLHLIDDNQYGFRSGHSTEDAVVKFIDYIERAKKEHKHVISIHIDVSKAFDSCNHEIMKSKLRRIGLHGNSLELMSNYMKDRIQELWLEGICGGSFVINIGVGQGTVLGPTLFKIYILDMFLSTGLFSLRFADDSNLVGTGDIKETTEQEINLELAKLHTWFCRNKLTLHPDKSRFIVHTKEKLFNIKLGNKSLMRCGYDLQEEGVKFLGVIIDENLDWKLHIKNIQKKIGKGNYLLWRYKNKLTQNMKRIIYESFIRTHLTYCLLAWGAAKSSHMTDLKKSIKKAWAKIGPRRQHTNERLRKYEILRLEDELKLAEVKMIWKWEKKKIALGLKDIIIERNNRNLRSRQFIKIRGWNNNSIAYRLANRAKQEIKDIETARSKKGLVKKYRNKCFLIEYNTQCRVRNCFICSQ
jgi:hypothetical protein